MSFTAVTNSGSTVAQSVFSLKDYFEGDHVIVGFKDVVFWGWDLTLSETKRMAHLSAPDSRKPPTPPVGLNHRILFESKYFISPRKEAVRIVRRRAAWFTREGLVEPKHRSSSFVQSILPKDTYEVLASILEMKPPTDVKESSYSDRDQEEEEFIQKVSLASLSEEESEDTVLSSDLMVNPPSSREHKAIVHETNPYIKFLKKPEHRAASWRPKYVFVVPPGSSVAAASHLLVDPKTNLSEKANAITNAIIKDFCTWIESLGGVEKSPMTEDTVQQLFEIRFEGPAAKALCVRIKELPVVTETIAMARNVPQASIRAGLKQEILLDIKAEKRPAKLVAFGTALPIRPPLRFRPPRNETKKRWIDCASVPRDLETMQVVWQDITDLRSTKAYCKWLLDHPTIPQPEYLRKEGLRTSIESQQGKLSLSSDVEESFISFRKKQA
ncbi:uncharacterized protein [Periplaneta americana]|uniref:uncharacterized protein n=1 Tax=Periplaneta americana TaxID=6978 RepID=UPI0037E8AF69